MDIRVRKSGLRILKKRRSAPLTQDAWDKQCIFYGPLAPLHFQQCCPFMHPKLFTEILRALPYAPNSMPCPSGIYRRSATREPLRSECLFTLTRNGMTIDYLVANGTVVEKIFILGGHADGPAPYGLRRGDSYDSTARKVGSITGLSSRYWTDADDPDVSYLQSGEVSCGQGLSYTIYVWSVMARPSRSPCRLFQSSRRRIGHCRDAP